MKTVSITAIILALFLSLNVDKKQFEGEIKYIIHNTGNPTGEMASLNLTFTNNRIFVDSNVSMNVMAGLSARGVLVRNDRQDFILYTDDKEGIKIEKNELDGLVTLMNRMQGKQVITERKPFPWDEKVTETGRSRQIQGYNSHEFRLKGDANGEYITVWLTDQIQVQWGVLLDAWYSTGTMQFEHEIPVEMIMNSSSFPLLIEVYKNNERVMKAEALSVNNSNFDRSKTSFPSDFKLLGLSDLMMNFFRQQR